MDSEYREPQEEIATSDSEYYVASSEFSSPQTEYWEQKSPSSKEILKDSASSKKKHKNLIRKMAYLTAATVATVTITQAPYTPSGSSISETNVEKNKDTNQFSFPKVNGVPRVSKRASYSEDNLWQMPDYVETYKAAHGNIIPVKIDGLWGLWDYQQNEILPPTYPEICYAANNDGYCIMNDDNYAYVLDPKGNVIYQTEYQNLEKICITDNNVIYVRQIVGIRTEDDWYDSSRPRRYAYISSSGEVIYEEFVEGNSDFYFAFPMSEGKGLICKNFKNDIGYGDVFQLVSKDGSILEKSNYIDTYTPKTEGDHNSTLRYSILNELLGRQFDTGVSNNYFSYMGIANSVTLVNLDNFMHYMLPFYLDADLHPDGEESNINVSSDYYFWDGQYFNSYGSKIVMTIEGDSGKTLSFLADLLDVNNDNENLPLVDGYAKKASRKDMLAVYERIYINHAQYLLCKDSGKWFYIDWNGKVVSEQYQDATNFTPEGYALIIQEDGTAVIINEDFEALQTIENVQSVGTMGDIFSIERNGEKYYFYYG